MNKFDFNEVEDFDKHIEMSIPDYSSLIHIVIELAECLVGEDGKHLDVGCSTGKLVNHLKQEGMDSYGIDICNLIYESSFLMKADYLTETFKDKYNLITSIFFLQFLREKNRRLALSKMISELDKDGYLIVCEKTHFDNPVINNMLQTSYLKYKLQNFTHEEILEKNFQLSQTMFLKTESELIDELSVYGDVSIFWKSYGFMGCIVNVKGE